MKTRVISGLLLVPLLVVVYFGGPLLWALCFLIAVLGFREFAGGFEKIDVKVDIKIGYSAAVLLYIGGYFFPRPDFLLLWIVLVMAASFFSMFQLERKKLADGMATLISVLYVVFFSYHMVLIDRSQAPLMIWLVLFAAFGTDIMAYFSGYLFGKHKLSPKISPKKTVEGAIGGTIGSIVLCTIAGYIMMPDLILQSAVIGLLGSVAAQLGDLTASMFKRNMGIKDYGDLIPGHGGVLDRFDSVLFTAPFVYYFVLFAV